jgi:hypothetical protein
MAAIGRRLRSFTVAAPFALCALAAVQARGDQAADVRAAVEVVGTGLSAGNPAQAMSAFDKSYANYDKLSGYFGGLTSSYQIVNEIDVVDETDSSGESKVTVHWIITLSDLATNFTNRREGDIQVRLISKDGKWKIIDFAPIDIFNPQVTSK